VLPAVGTRRRFMPSKRVHKRTDRRLWKCNDRHTPRKGPGYGENPMLFIAGLVIVSVAVVIIPGMRVLGSVNAAPLGWMSEQWLAEHRASHSP
jgi:hypothetical protein